MGALAAVCWFTDILLQGVDCYPKPSSNLKVKEFRMPTTELKIGALAKLTGTNAPTIRYYEEIGLLPLAARRSGTQRVYADEDVRRLTFIRRCRDFGFSIDQVRVLASLVQDRERPGMEARDLAQGHLLAIRAKLDELRELERAMAAFVESCDRSCAGGPGADCTILEELGHAAAATKCCSVPSGAAVTTTLRIVRNG
jgi:DNA-binding transcriptional MerR regulator